MQTSFCIRFSDIIIRFCLPSEVDYEPWVDALAYPTDTLPDAEFHVRLLDSPLLPEGYLLRHDSSIIEYTTDEGRLRIYPPLTWEDGCQVACLLCHDNRHILYYPAKRWDFYTSPFHCLSLIMPEYLLLRHNAFLLHSSVIAYKGKTLLFSGPSGAGKSTQAALWQDYLGAEILNGDRCVVMQKGNTFYGGGSPWAGTSGIYRPEQYPIAGIILPVKSRENRITQMRSAAFAPLFGQTVVNSWDSFFMESISVLFSKLLTKTPVYQLECRPDRKAVELVCSTLF